MPCQNDEKIHDQYVPCEPAVKDPPCLFRPAVRVSAFSIYNPVSVVNQMVLYCQDRYMNHFSILVYLVVELSICFIVFAVNLRCHLEVGIAVVGLRRRVLKALCWVPSLLSLWSLHPFQVRNWLWWLQI